MSDRFMHSTTLVKEEPPVHARPQSGPRVWQKEWDEKDDHSARCVVGV
jgi:hypothetical protein